MMTQVIDAVVTYFSGTLGLIELSATVILLINVYLLAKQKLVNYLFGFVGVLLFGYLFQQYALYSDMLLQWVFYAPLQIVGFIYWKYGHQWSNTSGDSLDVVSLKPLYLIGVIGFVLAATALLGNYMATNTDASFPYLDALTTWMSVVASLLMLRKFVENWIFWIAMDLIAIPLYFAKELYVTSGLYVFFLGLAIYGWLTWRKSMREAAS